MHQRRRQKAPMVMQNVRHPSYPRKPKGEITMKYLKTILTLVFVFFSANLHAEQKYFSMWCKAPIPIYYQGDKSGTEFSKNPVAAGPAGQNLQPGKCAWVDRPLNASEIPHIEFDDWPVRAHQLLAAAATTEGRRIRFIVKNKGGIFVSKKSIYIRP